MSGKPKYFISCCSAEFGGYRVRLRNLLGPRLSAQVVIQEDLPAGRATLLENLHNCIQNAQAVLHLIGHDAGHRPTNNELRWALAMCPGIDGLFDCDPSEFSYTQWECYFALHLNVDCYIFVADGNSSKEPGWVSNHQSVKSQETHVERLKSVGKDFRSISFGDPDELAKLFERALESPQSKRRMVV